MGHQQRPKPKDHRPRGGPQQRWSRLGFGGGGVDLEGKGGDRGLPPPATKSALCAVSHVHSSHWAYVGNMADSIEKSESRAMVNGSGLCELASSLIREGAVGTPFHE